MPWTRTNDYSPLPISSTRPPHDDSARSPFLTPTSSNTSRPRWNRTPSLIVGCLIGGFVSVILLSVGFVVPEDQLPLQVSTAVGKSREAFEHAKASWGWKSQQELDDELARLEEEHGFEGLTSEFRKELEQQSSPASTTAEEVSDEVVSTMEEAFDASSCSDEVRRQMGDPSFWIVKPSDTNSNAFLVQPSNPLPAGFPTACISQAVFSARLVSSTGSLAPGPETEILASLPRPELSPTLDSFKISIPTNTSVPSSNYELQVTLEFGFYPGVLQGTCGNSDEKVCDKLRIGDIEEEQLHYVGKRIRVEERAQSIAIATRLPEEASLPLCNNLSQLDGYWSSLSYYPTRPTPCALVTPTFPIALSRPTSSTGQKVPLWIHFVGDSNTRNMHGHLLDSFGHGHKISAAKVVDSKTHNGTHASIATRWLTGQIPDEEDPIPDLVFTWSWWYQMAPSPSQSTSARSERFWEETLAENREDLLRLVDTNLADYLSYAGLSNTLHKSRTLASIAPNLRPHRTYWSLGSHSEQLSVPGTIASLDYLLDENEGFSRSKRDVANLRFFTTTLVDSRYIPLDRFPRQDLVRNNAFIEAKNAHSRARPELMDESRVIDVEALTRGITTEEEGQWMKPGRNGKNPDAVHFRKEVYEEWVRLLWTDLLRGEHLDKSQPSSSDSLEMKRQEWKRRIKRWNRVNPDDDEEEDNDNDGDF
ncbi:uncharacterized protein JCM15063_002993 [Sporobolomyces koalae]|uniref:uncharacterized protein n=1 Tax=Sporobolomyces koalae TaxID=500713 RepID=UPI003171BCEC